MLDHLNLPLLLKAELKGNEGFPTVLHMTLLGKEVGRIQCTNAIADTGEACFASSGTNIRRISKSEAVFVSGGLSSHLFIRDKKIKIPFVNLKESVGANSLAVKNKRSLMVTTI